MGTFLTFLAFYDPQDAAIIATLVNKATMYCAKYSIATVPSAATVLLFSFPYVWTWGCFFFTSMSALTHMMGADIPFTLGTVTAAIFHVITALFACTMLFIPVGIFQIFLYAAKSSPRNFWIISRDDDRPGSPKYYWTLYPQD